MNGQYCVDTNIFITAWYRSHPVDVFPTLWKQLAQCRNDIILIKPIFDDIEPFSPADQKIPLDKKREKYPLRVWIENNKFDGGPVNDETEALSLELEKTYEITNESKGADQKDITLIAYAKIMDKTVITFEGMQNEKPGKKYNYKIPLICHEQDVLCEDFVYMLRNLGIKV